MRLPAGPCGPVRHAGAILSTSCGGPEPTVFIQFGTAKTFQTEQNEFLTAFCPEKTF